MNILCGTNEILLTYLTEQMFQLNIMQVLLPILQNLFNSLNVPIEHNTSLPFYLTEQRVKHGTNRTLPTYLTEQLFQQNIIQICLPILQNSQEQIKTLPTSITEQLFQWNTKQVYLPILQNSEYSLALMFSDTSTMD